MKKNLRLLMLLACMLTGIINVCKAQTQFWSDDLESTGPTGGGTRASSYSGGSGGPPNTRYFKQTTLANINVSAPGYIGIQGTQCWAAEDVDAAPSGITNEQTPEQSVTWSNINITGKTGLSFRGFFATGLATTWDHGTATLIPDYLIMQYQLNGAGAWITFLDFRPTMPNATNGALAIDNNADGLGDGTALNSTFTDFNVSLTGVTGTSINIRCLVNSNALAEEVAFDNFRLFETPACTAPSFTGHPPNRTICAGNNTTFPASATGATGFQWQVDQTGGGTYTNLSNVAPYSGVTTNTLTVTAATAGMTSYRFRVVAINGVASCFTNGNTATLTVSSVNTSSWSQTNIACFGGSTGGASVTPSGGITPYTYAWSPSVSTSSSATALVAGPYTVTVTDNIGCQGTRNFNIAQPTAAVGGSTVVTNVTCTGAATGTINLTPSGGTPSYTFNWTGGPGTEDRVNVAAGTYTVTITDANGCTGTVSPVVTEPATVPGSNTYTLPATNKTVTKTVGNANFVAASCELVNAVVASGSSPVSGSVTNKVWIEGAVPTQSGAPFVQRHYEITPAVSASTATGTVTLYFTQAEFDNFNAHAASSLNLPANSSDIAGKANLRIGKYRGVSGNGTGLPSSYSSTKMVIDPDDNNIVWNAVSNAWEITFAVNGFSGFVAQTAQFTLPVNWASFTVKKQNQSVVLNWSTASEQNTKDFIVQHSVDGVNWNTITTLAAAGNSSNLRNYSYVHSNTVKGFNYYRIAQNDLDGKASYSEVKLIDFSGDNAAFTVPGNRITNAVLQLQVHQTTTISLHDVNGKLLWKKQFTAGLQNMDVSSYSKGVYLLSAEGKSQKILIQ